MMKLLISILLLSLLVVSCRSTKRIQTAISKKDTGQIVTINKESTFDSLLFIRDVYSKVEQNKIEFTTFSAKVKVDYRGANGKNYDFNAFIRMKKDSIIWVSINAVLGIEAFRILITSDSVKVWNKLDKVAQFRSLSYLQEVTQLPFDFHTLQELIIGNPIYLDSNIVSYKKIEGAISLVSIGQLFKHFITVSNEFLIQNSKLDDLDMTRARTAVLLYDSYETSGNIRFSTNRKISVAEKSKLDVALDFKQFNFNESLSYPFNIPKNYKRD